MPQLTFLEADRPLVKSYALDSNGVLTKESYPRVWEFTSHVETVSTLAEFADALRVHADLGHCLLKGGVSRPLVCESRAGSTDPHAPTWFLCLDLDRTGEFTSLDAIMAVLGQGDVSYIVQYSASHGIEPDRGLTAHVFVMLERPMAPASLKQWLLDLNLTTPQLAALIELTKTNNALSWPLDVSTCQNDKLLYIAPPVLGEGVKAVFQGERIQVVLKAKAALDPTTLTIPTVEQNRAAMNAKLDVLRSKYGLPVRKWATKLDKLTGLELLAKPDASTLTGLKRERGFTYFNLNGGDSWGYFHADDTPGVIRNFKGEPNYPTAELLPEYWGELQSSRRQAVQDPTFPEDRISTLVFRDFKTAIYYNGTWDPAHARLNLARAASETQLQDYLKERGLPQVDFIPTWNLVFDPQSDVRVNLETRTINTFEASPYMNQVHVDEARPLDELCPTIYALIGNAVAYDPELRAHWLNWFNCIFTLRTRTMTAWALHGIHGTGKGVLVNHVMIPLLGAANVTVKRMVELEDQFNGYLASALVVVIDEAAITDSRNCQRIMADLKNMITEPQLSVRRMHTAAYTVPNFCNFMVLSNKAAPIQIEATDRRINVGEFRTRNYRPTDAQIKAIADELPAFANWLHNQTADVDRARSVMATEERALMMATSTNSIDTTAQALLAGDLPFFWDSLPAGAMGILGVEIQALHEVYTKLVYSALRAENGVQKLTRDELRVLFAYNIGDMPRTPAKFTALLRHHRIHLKPLRINGVMVRGLEIQWKSEAPWLKEKLEELGAKLPALRAIA